MGRNKNFISGLTTKSQLPGIPIPGHSLVEIAGNRRVLIENHNGVIAYTKEMIRVKTMDGVMCVCGTELVLECMSRFQLVITGCICGVTIEIERR